MALDLDTAPRIGAGWWLFGHIALVPPVRGALRLRATGRHHLPAEGPVLIVCNHISQADPPIIGVAALPRRSYYMAKIELFRIPVLRRIVRGLGAFPVDRGASDRRALRLAREILGRGDQMLMFPEGTRRTDGALRPGLPGAGTLGLVPGVTVIPAAIWGSHRFMRRVRVAFGPPVDLSDLTDGPRSRRSQVAVDRMMAAIADMLPLVGAPAQPPPGVAPQPEGAGGPDLARATDG
ncbi:MAG: lysophospholipid acyltransferase family protein [Miltoncostaeaceae bacterium]